MKITMLLMLPLIVYASFENELELCSDRKNLSVCVGTIKQVCDSDSKLVVNFLNGVNNDLSQATKNRRKTKEIINDYQEISGIKSRDVCAKLLYNQSEGLLEDVFLEAAAQKVREATEQTQTDWSAVSALVLNSSLDLLGYDEVQTSAMVNVYKEVLSPKLVELTETERITLEQDILPLIRNDIRRVPNITVSHSQGNLFANLMYEKLVEIEGAELMETNYANLQVASAAKVTKAKVGSYMTQSNDFIIKGIPFLLRRDSNLWISTNAIDNKTPNSLGTLDLLQGHSFIDFYTNPDLLGSFDEAPNITLGSIPSGIERTFNNFDKFKPMDRIFYEELEKLAYQIVPIQSCNDSTFKMAQNLKTNEIKKNQLSLHLNPFVNYAELGLSRSTLYTSVDNNLVNDIDTLYCAKDKDRNVFQVNNSLSFVDIAGDNIVEIAAIREKTETVERVGDYISIPYQDALSQPFNSILFKYVDNGFNQSGFRDLTVDLRLDGFNIKIEDDSEINDYIIEVDLPNDNELSAPFVVDLTNLEVDSNTGSYIIRNVPLRTDITDILYRDKTDDKVKARVTDLVVTKKYIGNKTCADEEGIINNSSTCPYSLQLKITKFSYARSNAMCGGYLAHYRDLNNNILDAFVENGNQSLITMTDSLKRTKSSNISDFDCIDGVTKNRVDCINKYVDRAIICEDSSVVDSRVRNALISSSTISGSEVFGIHSGSNINQSRVNIHSLNSTIDDSIVGYYDSNLGSVRYT